jgi:hypothetical protein
MAKRKKQIGTKKGKGKQPFKNLLSPIKIGNRDSRIDMNVFRQKNRTPKQTTKWRVSRARATHHRRGSQGRLAAR